MHFVVQFKANMNKAYFFTTSSFSKEAEESSIKRGAVPIILIDGDMIVDFMIDKHFGIEYEELPIYINALDNVLS